MATSKVWPSTGVVNVTPTTYSMPQAGNVNWASLTDFLVALTNGSQATTFQRYATRSAVTSPITVSTNDCVVSAELTVPASVAVTLPAGVDKQIFYISDGTGDANTHNITITPSVGETIGGGATLVLNSDAEAVMLAFQSSDTDWKIIGKWRPNPTGGDIGGFTINRAIVSDGTGYLAAATTTATEIGYVNGVTSSIQTQLNNRVTNPMTTTGDVMYASTTATPAVVSRLGIGSSGNVLVVAGGLPTWNTIANASITAAAAIDVNKLAALTVSRAVVTDGSGFISAATTTAVEIGYVNGVTSSIQTQLNSKQASGIYITALTGDVTASGPGSVAATLAATTNGTLVTLSALTTAGSLATVGTITSGTWSGTTVAINKGGTGVTSVTTAPAASAWAGWNANSNMSANSFLSGYTTTATGATTTTLTVASTYQQYFTGVTTQTVVLPVTSTLVLGQQFQVINSSNGVVTVQSSGANTVQAMAANTSAIYTCILTSGTSAASWSVQYISATGAGTVTSVALSVPSVLSISGSPVTTSGTLAIGYSGTALPIANGGTAVTSVTTSPTASSFAGWDANKNFSANNLVPAYTTTATAAGTTTLVVGDTQLQYFTGALAQTVKLPVTSTLALGMSFRIVNLSTGLVTLQSSGANTIQIMMPGSTSIVTCILTSGTSAASWSNNYATTSRTFPTIQKFTSSTGTYTTPAGVTYIQVEMVGGGGAGGGAGSAGGGTGGSGGNTTFGTTLLVANGGGGGTATSGTAGGTASLGSGPIGIATQGAHGADGSFQINGNGFIPGGNGASTPFGGGGGGAGNGTVGYTGIANTGAGGGGAGMIVTGNNGAGGAAGGYVKALISSPDATYSYAVGAAGTAGTAGGSGFAGGAGSSGIIVVTEYYN